MAMMKSMDAMSALGYSYNYIYRLISHGWGSIFVIGFSRHFQYSLFEIL